MSKNVPSYINTSVSTSVSNTSAFNNELRSATSSTVINNADPLFCGFSAGPTSRHLVFQFDISSLSGKTLTSAVFELNCNQAPASPPLYGVIRRIDPSLSLDTNNLTWNQYSSGNDWTSRGGDFVGSQVYITFPASTGLFSTTITALVQENIDELSSVINVLVMPVDSENEESINNSNITTIRISGANTARLLCTYNTITQELLGKKVFSGPDYGLNDYLNETFTGENPGNYGVKDDRNDAGGTNMINTRVNDPNSNVNMTVYGANHVEFTGTRVTNPSVGSLDVTVSGNTITNNVVAPSATNNGARVESTDNPATATGMGARVSGKTLPTVTSTGVKIINT